jgi:hypothetical protein
VVIFPLWMEQNLESNVSFKQSSPFLGPFFNTKLHSMGRGKDLRLMFLSFKNFSESEDKDCLEGKDEIFSSFT